MNDHSLLLIVCAICTLVGVWMMAYERGRIDGLMNARSIIEAAFRAARRGANMAEEDEASKRREAQ